MCSVGPRWCFGVPPTGTMYGGGRDNDGAHHRTPLAVGGPTTPIGGHDIDGAPPVAAGSPPAVWNCTYARLIDEVYKIVKVDREKYNVKMKYQYIVSYQPCAPQEINLDQDVKIFIHVVKTIMPRNAISQLLPQKLEKGKKEKYVNVSDVEEAQSWKVKSLKVLFGDSKSGKMYHIGKVKHNGKVVRFTHNIIIKWFIRYMDIESGSCNGDEFSVGQVYDEKQDLNLNICMLFKTTFALRLFGILLVFGLNVQDALPNGGLRCNPNSIALFDNKCIGVL
ncbi:hypothetical protein FNV43_RR05820 [Rhamnella rubrinervis]|uniref:Uncharacterized protein n=1 Tax=Rhamnella rubrinervis TaxID=2594499 RepID=A0A8K0HPS0_9ROSA|nr:hypothetical protein FNV43_RR05820 [Rhamnella rubrinervis]